MRLLYVACALVLCLSVVAGAFHYARATGKAECETQTAKLLEQARAKDAANREKADHDIRKVTDTALSARLSVWLRD